MATKGGGVSVEVEASQVEAMLQRGIDATSPPKIASFMASEIAPWYQQKMVDRFSHWDGFGAAGTVSWAPLTEGTIRYKEWLGVEEPEAPNIRTGAMFDYLVNSFDVNSTGDGATFVSPSGSSDAGMTAKITLAQEGGESDWGGTTPPRPVIYLEQNGVQEVLQLLENFVLAEMMTGMSPGGGGVE